MAESSDYKRGYGKGYNTGKNSADKRLAQMHDEHKQLVERVERAEKQQGLGHCEGCANWQRGCPTCAWGYCNAKRAAGTPWGTFIRGEDATGADGRIMTTPRFGCVLFQSVNATDSRVEGK